MISDNALKQKNNKQKKQIPFHADENLIGLQINLK